MRENTTFCFSMLIHSRSDDEHSARSSSIIKRRAQALIMFVGYAITPTPSAEASMDTNETTELISLLVDLTTTEGENIGDVVSVTQQVTSKVMNAIGAADFLNGALVMLQSNDTRVGFHFFFHFTVHSDLSFRSMPVPLKSSRRGYPKLRKLSVASNKKLFCPLSSAPEMSFLVNQLVHWLTQHSVL